MAHDLVRELAGIEGREEFICTAVTAPNDIVVLPSGFHALVIGNRNYAIGEKVAVSVDAIVDVDSASATLFAVGAAVRFDPATKLAVTATSPIMGTAELAKVNGQTKVRVRLNSRPAAA